MNAEEMERYLTLLGQELQELGVQTPIDLLLIGGGYMLTQIGNRLLTGDIDVAWVRPEIYSDSDLYRIFQNAVRFVAHDEKLDFKWLQTETGDGLRAAGPLPKMKLWKTFVVLRVYIPPKDFILAHKLAASRPKDMGDIVALCQQLRVDTRKKAQKIVDKYISREAQEDERIVEKLSRLFP